MSDSLVLKRASPSRSSGTWGPDDYDLLSDGEVVGRIFRAFNTSPSTLPWTWTLAYGHHHGRSPTQGFAATCEDAMAAFAKSWRRE